MSSNVFSSLGLSPSLLSVIEALGHRTPTPIQMQSIPVLLAGKDLIGQSKTGSGKTAAFALPILQRLRLESRSLQAMVVCPTRELCAQVAREIRKLGRNHKGLVVLAVTGGESFKPQAASLKLGVHVVVGTPGRLLDHLKRQTLDPRGVATIVLDEADRMLDMGFAADMESILRALPKERQSVLFSATFPPTIKKLALAHQRDAVHVIIDEGEQPVEIEQLALFSEAGNRLRLLYWVLSEYSYASALIFCNFKASVAEVTKALASDGASVDCFHGDLDQFERDQVLARFRNQSLRILVATDVAGRGIDVEDLDLVINYELPSQPEVYVHRVGRTGRAGKTGRAVSIHTPREKEKLRAIELETNNAIVRIKRDARTDPGMVALAKRFARPAEMDSILISGGRKDKIRPGDILGALTGDAGGLEGTDIGKIEIHDRLSYVAISKKISRRAVESLNKGRIKKKRFRATLVG